MGGGRTANGARVWSAGAAAGTRGSRCAMSRWPGTKAPYARTTGGERGPAGPAAAGSPTKSVASRATGGGWHRCGRQRGEHAKTQILSTMASDGQILILRDFMAALQPPPGSPHALNPDAIISPEHMQQLTNVKRDVVNTVRQVVDVVSKYTGGALPEPARTRVRGFILHLPQAWASAARRENVTATPTPVRGRGTRRNARRSNGELSRPVSPSSPRHSRQSSAGAGGAAAVPPTAGAATQAAQRILTLATESLDMMRGVTGVVKDSLDRADAWVERLRVVGLQRGAGEPARDGADEDRRLPPPLDLMSHRGAPVSASTSVASSPIMSSVVLPPLRSPAALSPLVYHAPEPSYFAEHQAGVNGIGKLNLGGIGKKGMFAEEGEIVVIAGERERVGDGGTGSMDVDG
ncbi:hypothetical protein BV25DRAFT_1655924 [Artomyces pyxidatus]|uniref:Uncharacterized protein n=1 Tax=Artomyces pyxidatus TaxID=48021 RepID=A0ACB8SHZ7_9AGAM|nr:hypothetical protein BV25DRAFT_1655924 [Artomyces pyxidatus]